MVREPEISSHGVQVHNLKKPTADVDHTTIAIVRRGNLERLRAKYRNPLDIIGGMSRALIKAAPGHRLYIADFSGIESRGAAWLCNETHKLEEWLTFDRTGDPNDDPYHKFGVEVLGLSRDIARNIGKTADLSFAYMGGPKAYLARDNKASYNTAKSYQQKWQRAHPKIKAFWGKSLSHAISAHKVHNTGLAFECERISYISESNSLFLVLPSGRRVAYPDVQLFTDPETWIAILHIHGEHTRQVVALRCRPAWCARRVNAGERRSSLVQRHLRGGHAAPGDCRLSVVLHLHDEIVCEVPIGHGSVEISRTRRSNSRLGRTAFRSLPRCG